MFISFGNRSMLDRVPPINMQLRFPDPKAIASAVAFKGTAESRQMLKAIDSLVGYLRGNGATWRWSAASRWKLPMRRRVEWEKNSSDRTHRRTHGRALYVNCVS